MLPRRAGITLVSSRRRFQRLSVRSGRELPQGFGRKPPGAPELAFVLRVRGSTRFAPDVVEDGVTAQIPLAVEFNGISRTDHPAGRDDAAEARHVDGRARAED